MVAGVVTCELRVSRLEGKFKLSQNRPQGDQTNGQRQLSASPYETEQDVARMMQEI